MLLADVASEFEPVLIRSALGLITGADRGTDTGAQVVSPLQRRTS